MEPNQKQGGHKCRRQSQRCLYVTFVAGALTVASAVQAEDKEIVVGLQCDRTGPTQLVGTVLCPGYHDYIALVNSKGGVEGYKIRVVDKCSTSLTGLGPIS